MSYILQFVEYVRFMTSSLSNLIHNLSAGTHKTKCKHGYIIKNVKFAELNLSIATVFLNTQTLKII